MSIKTIYLAAAVDMRNKESDPFEEMAGRLSPALCFMPKAAFRNVNFTTGLAVDSFVAKINFNALRQADALVAYHDGSPSIGMPMEIFMANYLDIPVILIRGDGFEVEKGVYSRLFSNGIINMDELTLEKVKKLAKCDNATKKSVVDDIFQC